MLKRTENRRCYLLELLVFICNISYIVFCVVLVAREVGDSVSLASMVKWLVNYDLERRGLDLIQIFYRKFSGRTDENHEVSKLG